MNKLSRFLKTTAALGANRVLQNAVYQFLLKSGFYRSLCPLHKYSSETDCGLFKSLPLSPVEQLLPWLESDSVQITKNAAEIHSQQFHPFGGKNLSSLDFNPVNGSRHWAAARKVQPGDLKLIWEPARFCWVGELLRNEVLTQNKRSANDFWNLLNTFTQKNPPNIGENWESAQEVALRLINISLAASVLLQQPIVDDIKLTRSRQEQMRGERLYSLAQLIQAHARRIPSTVIYARSQRNNHLLSEAAGLMTAACVLPDAASSDKWFSAGWHLFQEGLNDQLAQDGSYIQQSTNYHRLMLQLVIWTDGLLQLQGLNWPEKLVPRIQRSILWLNDHCDSLSGRACNLGHNDGALLFPFGASFADYRPTLQAASRIFLDAPLFPPGPWDELSLWLNVRKRELPQLSTNPGYLDHSSLRIGDTWNWGLLRATTYRGRPAHDDQLQTDIWFDGENITLDAGTYRYSGTTHWNNRLKSVFLHNTLTIDETEPMTDAGKFLWLDWDHARALEQKQDFVCAEHVLPSKSGLRQVRTLSREDAFIISDEVFARNANDRQKHLFRLHWLLPDQNFNFDKSGCLTLEYVKIYFNCCANLHLRVIRKGETIYNSDKRIPLSAFEESLIPWCGWYSPTYDEKLPALSVIINTKTAVPFKIETRIEHTNPQRRFLF